MAELQEFSIFESMEKQKEYIPHCKFDKFKVFCKKWVIVIFMIVFGMILVGVISSQVDSLRLMQQETREKLNEVKILKDRFTRLNESLMEELTKNLNDNLKALNKSHNSDISKVEGELEFYRRAASARNCKELYNHGFKTSGLYRIDPDKRYTGQQAFWAYCDSERKETIIKPIENEITFSDFSSFQAIPVEYGPTKDQIISLINHSGSCFQTIDLTCTHVPISAGKLWWVDRDGKNFRFAKFL